MSSIEKVVTVIQEVYMCILLSNIQLKGFNQNLADRKEDVMKETTCDSYHLIFCIEISDTSLCIVLAVIPHTLCKWSLSGIYDHDIQE